MNFTMECKLDYFSILKPLKNPQLFESQNDQNYLFIFTLHDYFGLHGYFDFENRQPYTIIPYCTFIWDRRVANFRKFSTPSPSYWLRGLSMASYCTLQNSASYNVV